MPSLSNTDIAALTAYQSKAPAKLQEVFPVCSEVLEASNLLFGGVFTSRKASECETGWRPSRHVQGGAPSGPCSWVLLHGAARCAQPERVASWCCHQSRNVH